MLAKRLWLIGVILLAVLIAGMTGSLAARAATSPEAAPQVPVVASNPYIGGSGIFLAWEWANGTTHGCKTDAEITAQVNWNKAHGFKYVFLNLTAVDTNGTLPLGKYDCLHNYLRVSPTVDPNQVPVPYLSGGLANVNDPTDWPNIAEVVRHLIQDMGAASVNLDFEPMRTDAATVANYKGLFAAIRNKVGSTANLSLDTTIDPGYQWSPADYKAISAYFNVMMPMSYDSSCTTVACYQTVLDTVWPMNYTNLAPGVQLMPILPAYGKNRWHKPDIENLCTSTDELFKLINLNQVQIKNVAVWWHYEWTATDETRWNSCWLNR